VRDIMDEMQLPVNMEQEMKSVIEQSFLHTISEIEDHEIEYIKKKFNHKFKALQNHEIPWVIELTRCYEILYHELYNSEKSGSSQDDSMKVIGAALFYFINPYDIIPDFTKKIGLLDDYYVLLLCLKYLDEDKRKEIFEKFKAIM
jgi:uncharacterized membrane protein YkvA (DUF1232 family)